MFDKLTGLTAEAIAALPQRVRTLLTEADGILTQGESWEATREIVRDAIRDRLSPPENDYSFWLRDIYNGDQAIYEYDGKCWQISFSVATVDGSQTVTLGEPTEVKVAYMPVGESRPADLAVEYVPLVEKAVGNDSTIKIKIIEPGWGSSGYYGADVLERDAAQAFPAGTKMYLDHPTSTEEAERPERSVRDLAATLESAAYWDAKGPDGAAVYGEAKVIDAYKPFVEELAPHIGVSIRAAGIVGWGEADGKQGPIVEGIVSGKSIDFVTEPGAGGKVLQLFESARKRIHESRPDPKGDTTMDEKKFNELREAQEKQAKELEETKAELARRRDADTLREAREIAAARLRSTDLPDFVQERVVGEVAAKVPVKEGAIDSAAYETAIDEAAKREAEYLGKAGVGAITGMGPSAPANVDEAKLSESLAESFAAMGLSEGATKIAVAGR